MEADSGNCLPSWQQARSISVPLDGKRRVAAPISNCSYAQKLCSAKFGLFRDGGLSPSLRRNLGESPKFLMTQYKNRSIRNPRAVQSFECAARPENQM